MPRSLQHPAFLALALILGCAPASIAPPPQAAQPQAGAQTGTKTGTGTTGTAAATGNTLGSNVASGSGDATAAVALVYPVLAFNGTGYTSANNDHLQMTASLGTNLSDASLVVTTTAAKVACGDVGGCDQSHVDSLIQQTLGATTYERSAQAQLTALEASGFKNAGFALYAGGIQGVSGLSFTFDKPLPVFPWPAALSRYDALNGGSQSWTANAVASQPVNLQPSGGGFLGSGGGASTTQFSVTVTVTKVKVSGSQVTLTLALNIPEDRNGMIYRVFPMPYSATYTIDTATQNVLAIETVGRTYSDDTQKQEQSDIRYSLCSKTTPGQQALSFPCPSP